MANAMTGCGHAQVSALAEWRFGVYSGLLAGLL
jgi:hypothetical protein